MKVVCAEREHLPGMAWCHQSAFPGSFMTQMGVPWLKALYGYFLRQRRGVSVVALDERGRVIGLAVGGDPQIRGQFLRYALYRYPHLIALGFLRSALIRKVLLAEMGYRMGPARDGPSEARLDSRYPGPIGNLLSIGVAPEAQGSGAAGPLLSRFQSECALQGYRSLTLSVVRSNSRAVRFYTRSGWEEVDSSGESARFALRLHSGVPAGPTACGAS